MIGTDIKFQSKPGWVLGEVRYKCKRDILVYVHTMSVSVAGDGISTQTALGISKESRRGNVVKICRKIYVDQCDLEI